jgi:DNA-binding transcriptional LysR family regulator
MPIVARFAARLQALHPGIRPAVLSLSSPEIENGLEGLTLDLGLGYTDRLGQHSAVRVLPQYSEQYFPGAPGPRRDGAGRGRHASRRARALGRGGGRAAVPAHARDAQPQHRRQRVRAGRRRVTPVIETNSILTLSLSVVAGEVCSVLPGALVGAALGYGELEALPLISPEVHTPIGFMLTQDERPSRALPPPWPWPRTPPGWPMRRPSRALGS